MCDNYVFYYLLQCFLVESFATIFFLFCNQLTEDNFERHPIWSNESFSMNCQIVVDMLNQLRDLVSSMMLFNVSKWSYRSSVPSNSMINDILKSLGSDAWYTIRKKKDSWTPISCSSLGQVLCSTTFFREILLAF